MAAKRNPPKKLKKPTERIAPYTAVDVQQDFNRLMNRFQRDFEYFWDTSWRIGRDMSHKARTITPFTGATLPSVDIEDQGKNYRLTVDLPGFKKEEVQVELEEDSVTINAKRSQVEEEKGKNYVRHERLAPDLLPPNSAPEPSVLTKPMQN